MAKTIGIDFGTTNSLVSFVLSGTIKSYLNDDLMPHPSAVGYQSGKVVVGAEAKSLISDASSSVAENVVRSPKAMLGKGNIYLSGREVEPASVVTDLMNFLKEDVLNQDPGSGADFSHAVVSIPVSMNGRTRKELRDALLRSGIHIVQFVHEPLAALYAYFKDQPNYEETVSEYQGKLALVFDWGGGTLDLTLCQVVEGSVTQIMNVGDNNVGGDYVDEAIRDYVIKKYREENVVEHPLDVNPGAKAKLLEACERAKIRLSERESDMIYILDYFLTDEYDPDIHCMLTRDELDKVSEHFVARGLSTISKLLDKLNIDQRQISLCLATGGMINMPSIKQRLLQIFGIERLEVSHKGDRIISEGCAWIAHDEMRMTLAKPIEVLEARQSYLAAFKRGVKLPIEGDGLSESLGMYCVDPRDGKAKFQILRPQHVNKTAAADPRVSYDNLVVKVDPTVQPFLERIVLDFLIDDNYVVHVNAKSSLTGDKDSCEIYDLEFSMTLSSNSDLPSDYLGIGYETRNSHTEGQVCARSNVTSNETYRAGIPGEVLYSYYPRAFDPEFGGATPIQVEEQLFYQPCSSCKRHYNHPDCSCGTR